MNRYKFASSLIAIGQCWYSKPPRSHFIYVLDKAGNNIWEVGVEIYCRKATKRKMKAEDILRQYTPYQQIEGRYEIFLKRLKK